MAIKQQQQSRGYLETIETWLELRRNVSTLESDHVGGMASKYYGRSANQVFYTTYVTAPLTPAPPLSVKNAKLLAYITVQLNWSEAPPICIRYGIVPFPPLKNLHT